MSDDIHNAAQQCGSYMVSCTRHAKALDRIKELEQENAELKDQAEKFGILYHKTWLKLNAANAAIKALIFISGEIDEFTVGIDSFDEYHINKPAIDEALKDER